METKKHFYIFRHGETDYNAQSRISGQGCDVPLSRKGREQAAALAEELAEIPLQIVYSSPLQRALETAEIAVENRNIPIKTDDRLKECNYGAAEGKLRENLPAEELEKYLGIFPDFKFADGETQAEAAERFLAALRGIAASEPAEHIGIAAHGGLIRFLFSHKLDTPIGFGIKNAGLYHLAYENGTFRLLEQ